MAAQSPAIPKPGFVHKLHPHIVEHEESKPVKVKDLSRPNLNGKIAIALTNGVGTMWCAYAFAILALIALPTALHNGTFAIIQWTSQTFIQLVMLSVIMVGQNLLGAASDRRAEDTYKDADATFHEAQQIQQHLDVQDKALADNLARLERVMQALREAFPNVAACQVDGDVGGAAQPA